MKIPVKSNEIDVTINNSVIKNGDLIQTQKPEVLCNCPLQCNDKVPEQVRKRLFYEFETLPDEDLQSEYIRERMIIRSIAKRLWEDERKEDGKLQRRVTCKYILQIPSLSHVINDTSLDTSLVQKNKPELYNNNTQESFQSTLNNGSQIDIYSDNFPTANGNSTLNGTDLSLDSRQTNGQSNYLSSDDDSTGSEKNGEVESESSKISSVEICQKAFMCIYKLREKRIRIEREKMILKHRFIAERKQRKIEQMKRTLTIAQDLIAASQPLIDFLENINCSHLRQRVFEAIEDDITLVNDFFQNQLWKPEYINGSCC